VNGHVDPSYAFALCNRTLFLRLRGHSEGTSPVAGPAVENRPCQDVRLSENVGCSVDRGARYKVYAATQTLYRDAHTPPSVHIGDTQFSVSACEEQALLGARADRVAEWRESPRRYRIDDREAPLQQRVVWEEPGQGPCGGHPALRH
jgi:hypothetical protein